MKSKLTNRLRPVVAGFLLSLLLSGCGGDSGDSNKNSVVTTTSLLPPFPDPTQPQPIDSGTVQRSSAREPAGFSQPVEAEDAWTPGFLKRVRMEGSLLEKN